MSQFFWTPSPSNLSDVEVARPLESTCSLTFTTEALPPIVKHASKHMCSRRFAAREDKAPPSTTNVRRDRRHELSRR
jgi:hypothetical protein